MVSRAGSGAVAYLRQARPCPTLDLLWWVAAVGGGALDRGKLLADGAARKSSTLLAPISFFKAISRYSIPSLSILSRVKTQKPRLGRRRRSGVVPFLKAPPWDG